MLPPALLRALPLVRSLGGAISSRRLPSLVPPLEFSSRIDALPAGSSSIDNDVYDDASGQTWHDVDRTQQLATLHLLNKARIPYFDRVWRQQLNLGVTSSPSQRPGAFLEVGCGGGVCSVELARLGYHITGVDPAVNALDQARAHARQQGLEHRTVFQQGSAYNLSCFPDASFDGVVMADVLEHLLDLPTAISEVQRVLKPGGVLVFDTINRTFKSYIATIVLAQEVLKIVPPNVHDWRLYIKPHELSFLLQSHGFLVDTMQFRGMAPRLAPDLPELMRNIARARERGGFPSPPLSDFVEVASIEVNYLGWAQRVAERTKGEAQPRDAQGTVSPVSQGPVETSGAESGQEPARVASQADSVHTRIMAPPRELGSEMRRMRRGARAQHTRTTAHVGL